LNDERRTHFYIQRSLFLVHYSYLTSFGSSAQHRLCHSLVRSVILFGDIDPEKKCRIMKEKGVHHSIIILLVIAFLLLISKCQNKSSAKGVYGKSLFTEHCSPCHVQNDQPNYTPGLVSLNNYDSVLLIEKLGQIKKDTVHGEFLKSVQYGSKEINSIYRYIREYFEPHY